MVVNERNIGRINLRENVNIEVIPLYLLMISVCCSLSKSAMEFLLRYWLTKILINASTRRMTRGLDDHHLEWYLVSWIHWFILQNKKNVIYYSDSGYICIFIYKDLVIFFFIFVFRKLTPPDDVVLTCCVLTVSLFFLILKWPFVDYFYLSTIASRLVLHTCFINASYALITKV